LATCLAKTLAESHGIEIVVSVKITTQRSEQEATEKLYGQEHTHFWMTRKDTIEVGKGAVRPILY